MGRYGISEIRVYCRAVRFFVKLYLVKTMKYLLNALERVCIYREVKILKCILFFSRGQARLVAQNVQNSCYKENNGNEGGRMLST